MFDDLNDEQLLNACGHAYDAACYYHAKRDKYYPTALEHLMDIVGELMRRSRENV